MTEEMLMSSSDFDLPAASILPPTTARLVRLGSEIAMEPPARPDFLHSVSGDRTVLFTADIYRKCRVFRRLGIEQKQ